METSDIALSRRACRKVVRAAVQFLYTGRCELDVAVLGDLMVAGRQMAAGQGRVGVDRLFFLVKACEFRKALVHIHGNVLYYCI